MVRGIYCCTMTKVLILLVLGGLCLFVAGSGYKGGFSRNNLRQLTLNLGKLGGVDVDSLGSKDTHLEKTGGEDVHRQGPMNTGLEKLGPRALRANSHCELRPELKFFRLLTKILHLWFYSLMEIVVKSTTEECQNCSLIREFFTTEVDTDEDAIIKCECGREKVDIYECACCYKVKEWHVLVCVSAGMIIHNTTLYVAVTVEDQALIDWSYKIKIKFLKYLLKAFPCVPFPPPLAFLSGCLTPTFETPSADNGFVWEFCLALEIALFQIPVLTLYTKCFSFGGNSGDRSIGGRGFFPASDDKKPAKAIVNDEENYNSLVCLSNTEKKKTIDRIESGKPEETIEKKERTNWNESKPTDIPSYLVVLHQRGAVSVEEVLKNDGSRLQEDLPKRRHMLERTKSEKWLNNSAGRAWEQPALTCGGVLLRKNLVLTICACIRSFYVVHKFERKAKRGIYPYDLTSLEIFMEIPGVVRTGAENYQLDPDPDKFDTESLCAKRLVNEEAFGLTALMMVMTFMPEITDPKPGQFVPWPPRMAPTDGHLEMVAFGMAEKNTEWVFRDSSGGEINFNIRAVNYHLKECPMTNYTETELMRNKPPNDTSKKFFARSRISGFCAQVNQSELCGGKIGFPLIAGGELRGLSALSVDCDDENSLAGAVFDPDSTREIEKYIRSSDSDTGRASPNDSSPRHIMLLVLIAISSNLIE